MKQKLLTLATLLLCAVSGAWAANDDPGKAGSSYLDITQYETIDAVGINSGAYKMYGYSENAGKGYLVVSAYAAYKSYEKQKWVTYTGASNQNGTWAATGIFLGSDFYYKDGSSSKTANSAKTNSSRAYSFKVTNCSEVYALVKSEKGSAVKLTAYPLSGDPLTRGDAAGSDSNTSKDINTLSVTGLNTSTIYEIVVDAEGSNNNLFYEIAFVTPLAPVLSVAPSSANAFSYIVGNGPSAAQTFTVTGASLSSPDITVSLNAGSSSYEISSDGTTYGTTNITAASGDDIYVRLKAGLSTGSYDGTLRFASDGASNVDIALAGSVTNQTYSVTYDLNGGAGDAPTQVPQENGAVFALAAAPTRDCYTFDGWLCDIDGVTYAAGADYTMTAAATTFTAQWTAVYASSIDFAAIVEAGTTASNPIDDFLAASNIFASNLGSSAWETSTAKSGFIGYKLKNSGATVKFLLKAGKAAKITLGSVGDNATLKKGEVSTTITQKKADDAETIVPTIYAADDMVVSLITSSNQTVTLKKIEIYDSEEIAIELPCEGGLGTFYHGSKDLDFSSCSAKAYVVTDISASSVTLKEVTLVPVGEGVVVKGTSKGETVKALTTTMTSDEVTAFYALDSKLYAGSVSVTSDGQYWALSKTDGKFHPVKAGVTIPAGKAYLPGSEVPAGANFLSLDFGEGEGDVTGIEAVESHKVVNNNVFYNLAGQQVAQPSKGLYIVNGKKVIIK